MSSGFSANQYDNAFKSQRLQNWCQPKRHKERPTAKTGQTRFIVDDRGHLLPGLKRKDTSWSDFKSTWELPARIPAHSICPTARSEQGLRCLKTWGFVTPCPDTTQTAGGHTEREGTTERKGNTEGRRSTQQQEKAEDAALLENSGQTQEKEQTQTPKPTAAGQDAAGNLRHAAET